MNANAAIASSSSPKWLNVGLWLVQILLAIAFAMAGEMKLSTPIELLQVLPWVRGSMGSAVRFIGAVEVVGAIGLVVPAATRIQPQLTPLAALGLAVVMVLAMLTHIVRGELPMVVTTFVLAGLASFIVWGRLGKGRIPARA